MSIQLISLTGRKCTAETEEDAAPFIELGYKRVSPTKAIQGDRYTQADRLTRNRNADHLEALATDDPLMHLHGLGYDVSTASVVDLCFDPYAGSRMAVA